MNSFGQDNLDFIKKNLRKRLKRYGVEGTLLKTAVDEAVQELLEKERNSLKSLVFTKEAFELIGQRYGIESIMKYTEELNKKDWDWWAQYETENPQATQEAKRYILFGKGKKEGD